MQSFYKNIYRFTLRNNRSTYVHFFSGNCGLAARVKKIKYINRSLETYNLARFGIAWFDYLSSYLLAYTHTHQLINNANICTCKSVYTAVYMSKLEQQSISEFSNTRRMRSIPSRQRFTHRVHANEIYTRTNFTRAVN